ncbi:MAG: hypothetical protein M0P71_03200 [Melioribacteraceae bacterium]|nr:hypothetical protein [Melioribacteraceae bacterium]
MIIKDYFSILELLQPLRNILAILVIISFAYFLNSCNAEENKIVEPKIEETKVDTLIPLNVGNYWIYNTYYYNKNDSSYGNPFYLKSGFIIDGKMEVNSKDKKVTAYKLFTCGEDLEPSFNNTPKLFQGSKLIYQEKDGIYLYGKEKYDSLITSDDELIFTTKYGTGKEYRAHKFYYSTAGDLYGIPFDTVLTNYEFISTDSLISTPAGDFRCFVFKMAYFDFKPISRDEIFYFICPKIGIVAMTSKVYHYNSRNYTPTKKILLTDYKIKKDGL